MSTETASMATPVPALNLAANFHELRDELLAEIQAVCESGYYVLGPKVAAFEEALAASCGARRAVALSSGTDALLLSLMALGVGPGDEVVVPSFTFFATAGVVARLGAKPVFCDVHPDTFNAGAEHFERFITKKTKVLIPVHLYGQMAEMKPIEELARRRGLAIVEDACQAIGAREPGENGRYAGAVGTFGALSFYPTKNLGALGDAGAVLTSDEQMYELARRLRIHGSGHTYYHEVVGGNFRIDALQAAILTIKLKRLPIWARQRAARARVYNELFVASGLTPEFVHLPSERNGHHVYHQYVIRADRRDGLFEHLKQRKIGAGIYYPLPLHLQKCFLHLGGRAGDLPSAERAAAEVLALPMYPELTDVQQAAVVQAVREFYRL
ncbi:MAG: DegT/DnrJ/EryC1/StrS family aminotransferase [Planctomycetes bacterium]|nr:DegT/DnrJ/EryC1/StrS family aminotransferase [Planctomycetota bacterium]